MSTQYEEWQFAHTENDAKGVKEITKPTLAYLGMDEQDAVAYKDRYTTVEYVEDDAGRKITVGCSCGGSGAHDGGVCVHRYHVEWHDRADRDGLSPDDPDEWEQAIGITR